MIIMIVASNQRQKEKANDAIVCTSTIESVKLPVQMMVVITPRK